MMCLNSNFVGAIISHFSALDHAWAYYYSWSNQIGINLQHLKDILDPVIYMAAEVSLIINGWGGL